jgi:hypothetical protein
LPAVVDVPPPVPVPAGLHELPDVAKPDPPQELDGLGVVLVVLDWFREPDVVLVVPDWFRELVVVVVPC